MDDTEISREWIESAIMTAINPRVEDVHILPIPVSPGRSLYVIKIQKTFRGPHQASNKMYYKRHNFKSMPMEDYEINDIRNRSRRLAPLVSFEVGFYRDVITVFDIANIGDVVAEDVAFEFSAPIPWPDNHAMPSALSSGIRRLAPKQKLRFRYFSTFELIDGTSGSPLEFNVRVSYFHPLLNARTSDDWPVNLEAYRGSMDQRSEMQAEMRAAVDVLKKLTETVDKLSRTLDPLRSIAGATGLDLSVSTLRNIKRLATGSDPEPIQPQGAPPSVLSEVLGVDRTMALKLHNAFSHSPTPANLRDVPGMDEVLLAKIRSRFFMKDDTNPGEIEAPVL